MIDVYVFLRAIEIERYIARRIGQIPVLEIERSALDDSIDGHVHFFNYRPMNIISKGP